MTSSCTDDDRLCNHDDTPAGEPEVPCDEPAMPGHTVCDRHAVRRLDPAPDDAPIPCGWFALCDRTAEYLVTHPTLGWVAACVRCVHRTGYSAPAPRGR